MLSNVLLCFWPTGLLSGLGDETHATANTI